MRLVVDTLIAVMLIAVLGGLVLRQRSEQSMLDRIGLVQQSIRAIESQALYRAAVGDAEGTPRGFAREMEASWFARVPQNELIADCAIRPWVDVAPRDAQDRLNPRQIVADGPLASFWYNPERGTVRARVPDQMSQQGTVDLYNLINGTSLRIDDVDWTSARAAQLAERAGSGSDASPTKPEGSVKPGAPEATKLPVAAPTPQKKTKAKAADASASAESDPVVRDLLGPRR